jgi:hypothetical protein
MCIHSIARQTDPKQIIVSLIIWKMHKGDKKELWILFSRLQNKSLWAEISMDGSEREADFRAK